MRLNRGERWTIAAALTALATMLGCFALRALPAKPLATLPPALVSDAGEEVGPVNQVDLNTADLKELMSLPNIGQVRAQAILDDRAANGPYRYPEDLIRVPGIGEGIVQELLDYVTTGGEEDAKDFGG